MEDLSQRGSQEVSPHRGEGYSARRRTALALDLAKPSEKRSRIASLSDLALNELASPGEVLSKREKEKTILQTPTPTQFLFPKNVTEEQEAYASGFELALKEIYKEKGPPAAHVESTEDQGTVCSEVNPIPVSAISSVSDTSTTCSKVSETRVSQVPFKGIKHTFGNQSVAKNANGCSNFLSNFASAAAAGMPKSKPVLQQCVPRGCDTISNIRNATSVQGVYSSGHHEGHGHDVIPSTRHLGGSSGIDHIQMTNCKSAAGHSVRNWVPSDASIPQIHSHGLIIPSNPHLVGPVQVPNTSASCRTAVYSKGFGNALSDSDHVETSMQAVFPARSQMGTSLPVHAPQTDFHSYGSQRMLFSPGSTSLPVSNIYPETGLQMPLNQSWSGVSSSLDPVSGGSWMSGKGGMAPVGVVNMDEQERLKLERKRAKNRVAAQRCQMRKLERITRLEDKAEKLREQNSKLLQTVDDLRAHIAQLKKQITAHANRGCRLMVPDVSSSSINPIVSSL